MLLICLAIVLPAALATKPDDFLIDPATHAASMLVDPPLPSNGTFFAGSFGSGMVLQKGTTARASIYGVSFGVTPATKVMVQVTEGSASYTVEAEMTGANKYTGNNVTWKAFLKPHPEQGGNLTIAASCSACTNTTPALIERVDYGDVW